MLHWCLKDKERVIAGSFEWTKRCFMMLPIWNLVQKALPLGHRFDKRIPPILKWGMCQRSQGTNACEKPTDHDSWRPCCDTRIEVGDMLIILMLICLCLKFPEIVIQGKVTTFHLEHLRTYILREWDNPGPKIDVKYSRFVCEQFCWELWYLLLQVKALGEVCQQALGAPMIFILCHLDDFPSQNASHWWLETGCSQLWYTTMKVVPWLLQILISIFQFKIGEPEWWSRYQMLLDDWKMISFKLCEHLNIFTPQQDYQHMDHIDHRILTIYTYVILCTITSRPYT